jgi:hypothetical protein
MENTVIHIGYPKTGTTTLQSVMQEHPDVFYLGKGIRDSMEPSISLDLAASVFFSDRRRFERKILGLREAISKAAREARCVFVSDEAFSFAEFMKIGTHWERQVTTDHEDVAERLSKIFPDARVIMSIRGQIDFLKSFYRQSEKVGNVSGDFARYVGREIEARDRRSMLTALDYADAFESYRKWFGDDKVMLFLYEDYMSDFSIFLKKVSEICGLDVDMVIGLWGGRHENKAPSYRPGRAAGVLRRLVPAWCRGLVPEGIKASLRRSLGRKPLPCVLDKDMEAIFENHFAAANQRLEKEAGIDLPAAFYPGGSLK